MLLPITVRNLRTAGMKVKCHHQRYIGVLLPPNKIGRELQPLYVIREKQIQNYLLPNGGKTTVNVRTKEGKEYEVSAECSIKDTFDRKKSLLICMGRLEKQFKKDNYNPFEGIEIEV